MLLGKCAKWWNGAPIWTSSSAQSSAKDSLVLKRFSLFLCGIALGACQSEGQGDSEGDEILKAFPSAVGAGANATGGRGGKVCHVNTLEWDAPGEALYDPQTDTYSGSFYDLFYELDIPAKQIVFDVAGTIIVPDVMELRMDGRSNITVSGQTAPGKIVFESDYWTIKGLNNVVFRYVSFTTRGTNHEPDALWLQEGTKDVVFDHCSFFYGADECLAISGDSDITNVTVQWALLGGASKGMILGAYEGISDVTMAYSAFVDNNYRFPNLVGSGGSRQDAYNIFAENYGGRLIRTTGDADFNIQNFYMQPNRADYGIHRLQYQDATPPLLHSSGHIIQGVKDTPTSPDFDLWSIFAASTLPEGDPLPEHVKVNEPMEQVGIPGTIYDAKDVPTLVLPLVGNNVRLDENGKVVSASYALDEFYLDLAMNPQSTTSPWRLPDVKFPVVQGNTSYDDTDRDGMPDAWEMENGFDPLVNDSAEDEDGDGYTNLEEFLNRVDVN